MRSSDSWKLRLPGQGAAKKWSYCLLVFGLSLGLLALAAGVATSDRSHRDAPVPAGGIANAYSGGGNLVPVF